MQVLGVWLFGRPCPQNLDSLDPIKLLESCAKLQELSPQEGGKKMCLTWSVDFFWCNELSGMDVPILSGGLLAISRSWWHESGGHFG